MTTDNLNRYRVSTKFIWHKFIAFVIIFVIVFNLIRDISNDAFSQKSIIGLILPTLAVIGIFYFVSNKKRIDYDYIKQILYIVDIRKQTEVEIPVENIDKILFSSIGRSYVITYRDFHNQSQKVRLYPIPFDKSIDTIITDVKLKNPDLVTRKWSFGLNEFFD